MTKFKTIKIFKTKEYEIVINEFDTKFGKRYHVYGNKKENNHFINWFPSKDFKIKNAAFNYAKKYMKGGKKK